MSFGRSLKSPQRLVRVLDASIDGTGTPALSGTCKNDLGFTDNGTGDYTLTFNTAFARTPTVVASPLTADVIIQITSKSLTGVTIKCFDATDGTTAKDADVDVIIIGSDSQDAV